MCTMCIVCSYWYYHGHQCLHKELINCSGCFSCASFILHRFACVLQRKCKPLLTVAFIHRSNPYVLLAIVISKPSDLRFHSCYFCEFSMWIQYVCCLVVILTSQRIFRSIVMSLLLLHSNAFHSYYWHFENIFQHQYIFTLHKKQQTEKWH